MTDIVTTEKLEAIVSETTKEMSKFTKDFLSAYKSAVVEEALSLEGSGSSGDGDAEGGADEEAEPTPTRELLSRNGGEPSDEPIKTGLLTKRGDVRKNWKERFFVVRPDHMIEYYENEDKYKTGAKPKGTINLAGYVVVTDPNARKVKEKKKAQAVYGVNFSGEYTKYEPFTIECYHDLKRRWLIKCQDPESFNAWSAVFTRCAKKVKSGTLEDEQMQEAFDNAAKAMGARLKEKVQQGTEVEVLTQMLAPRAWRLHIGDKPFGELSAPPAIKMKARDKGFQVVYKAVEGAILGSWKALLVTTTAASDKTKEVVAAGLDPVRTARASTTEKISGAITDTIEPVKEKVLAPLAENIVGILAKRSIAPILSVDDTLEKVSTKHSESRSTGADSSLKGIKNKLDIMKPVHSSFLDFTAAVTGEAFGDIFDSIVSKVDALGDAMDTVKDFLQLGDYVDNLREAVYENTENAGYTFEKLLEDAMEGDSSKALEQREQVLQSVKEKYRHDMRMDQVRILGDFLTGFLGSILFDKVGEVCESICEPFDSLIPEALQDLISVSGMLGEVLEAVIENVVETAVEEGLKQHELM